jgi:hypothetical protein
MPGFWMITPDGNAVHINGNPDMSEEIRLALSVMLDEAAKQFSDCAHDEKETIYTCPYGPHYTLVVVRCQQCSETTVKVMGNNGEEQQYLATLPTRIAPYASNKPTLGYAYYWYFDGLNHSVPVVSKTKIG